MNTRPRIVPFLLLLAGLTPARAVADVILVDPENGPYFTINAALAASSPYDTIEVLPGVYPEALYPNQPVTVRSRDGAGVTILDGEGYRRILDFHEIEVAIEGLTFRNGSHINGGGAVRCASGFLRASGCAFRDNVAAGTNHYHAYGGAVLIKGTSTASFVECSFIGNEAQGRFSGRGGAIAVLDEWAASKAGRSPQLELVSCSFLRNRARRTAAVHSEVAVEIYNCLFVDKQGSPGEFVSVPDGSTVSCCLFHDHASPLVEDTWNKVDGNLVADPMICPDDPESVHESSPTRADWNGCGSIGSLPVACRGPMGLAVRPLQLHPKADQAVRVYGYGLEGVVETTLEDPAGGVVPATEQVVDGPWLTVRFDLEGRPPGLWTLTLGTEADGEIPVAQIVVTPIEVYGFFDGWVPEPVLFDGRISGASFVDGMDLELRHADDEEVVVPVEVLQRIDSETLLVRIDLEGAPGGPYDLVLDTPIGETVSVEPALYLGTPPAIRVPEDAPTIAEALAIAPPCADVLVGPGWHEEHLVIDKPVRLRAANPDEWTHIAADAPDVRVIHVLPEAGPLTQIEALGISRGQTVGPGGGILCEAPAMIRNCRIGGNSAEGPGARGAGIHAAPGARIVDNRISSNRVDASPLDGDVWSTDPETGGAAGGLFCLGCWIEGNRIEENTAPSAGGLVATGVIRDNEIVSNGSHPGDWMMGAVRGEITNNRFDNCCGSDAPYLLVSGPSRIEGNTFTEIIWELCRDPNFIHLKGSIDLVENIFAGVGIKACLRTDDVDEPSPGHFRMERNFFGGFTAPGMDLYLDDTVGICVGDPPEPQTPIPPDSLLFSCNYAEHPIRAEYHHGDGYSICHDCILLLDALPPGCPDTMPRFEYACNPVPVLLQSQSVEAVAEGVRLRWSLPSGVSAEGFDVEREHSGRRERLTEQRLPFCRTCEFTDEDPPSPGPVRYWVLIYTGGAEPALVELGIWDGEGLRGRSDGLTLPSPHPVRDESTVRFTVPTGGAWVRLEVFDLQGRSIGLIDDRQYDAGSHGLRWEAKDGQGKPLAAGVYLLRMEAAGRSWVRKIIVIR